MNEISEICTSRLQQWDRDGQDEGRSVRQMVWKGASRSGWVRWSLEVCGHTETIWMHRTKAGSAGNDGEWLGRLGKWWGYLGISVQWWGVPHSSNAIGMASKSMRQHTMRVAMDLDGMGWQWHWVAMSLHAVPCHPNPLPPQPFQLNCCPNSMQSATSVIGRIWHCQIFLHFQAMCFAATVNAKFLIFSLRSFATSVIAGIWQCQISNSGMCLCECCIFTKFFCHQCNCWNLALLDLGIPAKWLAPVNARFLIFSPSCFAASVSVAIWQCQIYAGFRNSGKVTSPYECQICQCQIFDIFQGVLLPV